MEYTVNTSKGPVRFVSVGEPIAGVPVSAANSTDSYDPNSAEYKELAARFPKAAAAGASLGNLQRLAAGTVQVAGGGTITKAAYDRTRLH